ncbi:hypothetical protein [Flavobacterium sp.]|uniref:hypothetical protein n=1 Tax=Flavobacterium sp. TaxID=239 RepID=UPI0012099CEA|nr:hypothetical protein [Flavobacterium sp.]RZJ70684.1 MAG: hypothetical protein EOO49_12585 [Flavobacterium sp.]
MPNSHSLKADGKPMLFSYDLETEIENIERWSQGSKADGTSVQILKKLASDYIEIIDSNSVSSEQLQRLHEATSKGKSGIWERAVSRLELLVYHFDEAKLFVVDAIKAAKGATLERLLNVVSDNFSSEQQLQIFGSGLASANKKIRMKAAEMCLDSRNMELVPMLESKLASEVDPIVKSCLKFAIRNMHQPKGELVIDMDDEDDD